ncbi:diacylglycerol kinase family protein [Taibaiella soli]|uniref:Diacylglycerol kinase n=1 Tax=Taibaiella soli TaxID=1649169 RepID=A0A2W2ALC1_9BACT|nr:diacylglycerol kinase family protein [Taibaiella soli]PZF73110.1 diacylglycerol kinase [Taibaiella soli]
MQKKLSFSSRLKSFTFALAGIKDFWKSEPNARLHLIAAILAVIASFALHISRTEWLFVLLAITLVFAAEMFNTALETLCDKISPEIHPLIKKTKDLAAGGVLVTAAFAFITGMIIFLPKIIALF